MELSMSAQEIRVTDRAAKWELAERIAGHANAPKQALVSTFTGIMSVMEEQAGTTFATSLKKKIWNQVSPNRLESIKTHLLSEFCDKILGSFTVDEAIAMLEEHKNTGAIKQSAYSAKVNAEYQLHFSEIIESVSKKAKAMSVSLVPEVVESLEGEGIEFLGIKT